MYSAHGRGLDLQMCWCGFQPLPSAKGGQPEGTERLQLAGVNLCCWEGCPSFTHLLQTGPHVAQALLKPIVKTRLALNSLAQASLFQGLFYTMYSLCKVIDYIMMLSCIYVSYFVLTTSPSVSSTW